MLHRNIGRFTGLMCACIIALAFGIQLFNARTSRAQEGRTAKGKLSSVPAEDLNWPLPPGVDKSYDAVDAKKLHRYVEELAATSDRYRDAGNQWWGRIDGTSGMTESQNWIKEKFKEIGVPTETVTLPDPKDLPKSWEVSVSANGKTVKLESSSPFIDFPRSVPTPKGDEELDAVWVSLGQPSDFLGKDIGGKAVFIYSIPQVGNLLQSSDWMEAVGRAEKAGAAAIIVDIAIPGNMHYVSHIDGGRMKDLKIPIFTIGNQDGHTVEELNAMNNGVGLKTHLRWEIEHYPDAKEDIVIGKLQGMTDENIILLAHMDGYFEGATDDASGTATVLGTAEYFARMPKEERRRTMYFISMPDHHGGDKAGTWLHENFKSILAKTAVVTNAEHVSAGDWVFDRQRTYSNAEPSLVPTNSSYPGWWGVYGSDRLAHIVAHDFATFGVPTQIGAGGMESQLTKVQFDAPSFYLVDKNFFFHSEADTPDKVVAGALRNVVQAFAKIYNDVNKLELKDLQAPPSERPGAVGSDQGQ